MLFFRLLKSSSTRLTIILHLYFFSSLYSTFSTIHMLPYSFVLMSFLWCTWNTTALPSSPLCYFGFDYAIHFPFSCPTPILGAIWDGPCSVPPVWLPFYSVLPQDLCSFLPPVSQVAHNISFTLQYSPVCPSKAAWNRGSPLFEVSRFWFLTLHRRYVCNPSAIGIFFWGVLL